MIVHYHLRMESHVHPWIKQGEHPIYLPLCSESGARFSAHSSREAGNGLKQEMADDSFRHLGWIALALSMLDSLIKMQFCHHPRHSHRLLKKHIKRRALRLGYLTSATSNPSYDKNLAPVEARSKCWIPWTGVIFGGKLPHGCWELKSFIFKNRKLLDHFL